jgi:molybdenum cofactor cytidylyltransferase
MRAIAAESNMTQREDVAGEFVSALVLAAGSASRMGEAKQVLPLAGRPLLDHVLDAADGAKSVSEVVLILGCDAETVRHKIDLKRRNKVRITVNADWSNGLSSSLKAGLAAADQRAVAACVLLADQPAIDAECIDRMIGEFFSRSEPLVRPIYKGIAGDTVPGHPVVVSREIWKEIEGLDGDEGLRTLISLRPEWLGAVAMDGTAPDDIDDRNDYARARRGYEN